MPGAYTVVRQLLSFSSQTCKHFAKYRSTSIMAAYVSEMIRTEEDAGKFEFLWISVQTRRFLAVFFFNFKAVAPLLQGDVLILAVVTLIKKVSYTVLHVHQRCSQRSKLEMCQNSTHRMLVEFTKLPVHRIHIHVVFFLKDPYENVDEWSAAKNPFIKVHFLEFIYLLLI